MEISGSALAARLCARFELPDWIESALVKEFEERLETGSDDRKGKEAARIEAEFAANVFIKGPRIANGAFGEVFKGVNKSTKEVVAIKVIDLEETKEDLDVIRREISLMAQSATCPQMTRYFSSQVIGSNLQIAMEFMGGGAVSDLIKDAPLDEPHIQVIAREVLLGLKYLHSEKKIHRDIKAANILLSSEGAVKLADFGASATLTETVNKRNTFVGSPYWMSPEILTGCEYGNRVDIWSLGITMIECAKQKPPNSHLPPLRVLSMIPVQPPPRLKGEQFSDNFRAFVDACLQKEPDCRPSAVDLLKHPFITTAVDGFDLVRTAVEQRSGVAASAVASSSSVDVQTVKAASS